LNDFKNFRIFIGNNKNFFRIRAVYKTFANPNKTTLSSYVETQCRYCVEAELKAKDWRGGTDNYGFSALPGGRFSSDGEFEFANNSGYWWSASEEPNGEWSANASSLYISDNLNWSGYNKSGLLSVRCIKD